MLECQSNVSEIAVSFGYCELNLSPYDGTYHIDPKTGKIKTQGVVGTYYGDRYFTAGKGTLEKVEFPDERTARYMTIHVTFPKNALNNASFTLKKLGIVKSQYPVVWQGDFTCVHPRLQQLIELSKIHAEITMSDTYIDTPGREDGQWLEDIRLRARIAETWFGDSDLRVLTLSHAQECRHEGRFLSFAPQSFVKITGWDWGMQWISMLYDEWKWNGNSHNTTKQPRLQEYIPRLIDYTKLLLGNVGEDGLFRTNNVFADIRAGAHPKHPNDVSVIVHCWLIERIQQAIELARVFDENSTADHWSYKREQMIDAFHEHLIVNREGKSPYAVDVLDSQQNKLLGKSQAAQISAIMAGLFSDEESLEILNEFFPAPYGKAQGGIDPWNNPTYLYRALEVLSRYGLGERALAHLLWRCDSYLPFSSSNPVPFKLQGPLGGPLPEYFITHQEQDLALGEPSTGQPQDPTGSHGWAAVGMLWVHHNLLGVEWEHGLDGAPGGRVTIAPKTYGLPFVSGHVMTPKGEVFVHWEPKQFRLVCEIPEDVSAAVHIPFGEKWEIIESPAHAEIIKKGDTRFQIDSKGRYVFMMS